MKFLDNFLLKYIKSKDLKLDLEKAFVDLGFEVEEVIKQERLQNAFIGKVVDAKRHPNADKLKLCTVELKDKLHQVVCGGINVDKNQYIVYAPSGSVVKNITLEKKNLRGVESDGMILSVPEILGLDDSIMEEGEEHNIFIFQNDIDLNTNIKTYFNVQNNIFDVTILNDRSYASSYLAMARELSAYYKLNYLVELPEINSEYDLEEIEIKVDNFVNGYYYANLKINDSKTPLWMKTFLYYHNIKPSNTLRDVIAYVSIMTGNIYYYLDENIEKINIQKNIFNDFNIFQSDVMLSKEMSGILFGFSSSHYGSISDGKNTNRDFGSKQLKGTTSTYLNYGLLLILKIGKEYGFIRKNSNVVGIEYKSSRKIVLEDDYFKSYVGMEIDLKDVKEKLKILGFYLLSENEWSIPSYRNDINTKQDLIEEIVRIYGVNNIVPKEINLKREEDNTYENFEKNLIFKVTNLLAKYNFQEIKTYQLINENLAKRYNFFNNKELWKIRDEYNFKDNVLRTSLFNSLLDIHNRNYKNDYQDINLFEISNININGISRVHLGLVHDDNYFKEEPLLATKQLVIEVLRELKERFNFKINKLNFKISNINIFDKSNSYKIFYEDIFIGIIGQISIDILREYKYVRLDKIKNTLYYLELNLNFLNTDN